MIRWLLFCIFSFVFAYADIGYVKSVEGEVFILRDNFLEPLQKDDVLKKNDLISTKKSSRAILTFKDDTSVTIGQNSDFSILEYLYDEESAENNKLEFFYSRGVFKTVSGKLGKLNQKNFKLKTRTASMGIRGTEIYTKTDMYKDMIACLDGAITVTSLSTQKSVNVDKGYSTTVEPDKDPEDPKLFSCDDLDGIDKEECKEIKADNDADGILDFLDDCPNTGIDFLVDYRGCPSGFNIGFRFAKNSIDVDMTDPDINKVAEFLKENKSFNAQIIGYTDSAGNPDKNLRLSKQRAVKVLKALIELGIEEERLSSDGYGAKDFIATNATEEGRKLNRRIYVKFVEEF